MPDLRFNTQKSTTFVYISSEWLEFEMKKKTQLQESTQNMYKIYLRPWTIEITNHFRYNIPQGGQHTTIATETGNSWSFSISLSSFLCLWNKHSMICFLCLSQAPLHMDITRWSILKSDWLYSLQPKMEKLYTVSKNKTRSWLWLRSWTPYYQILTQIEESRENH